VFTDGSILFSHFIFTFVDRIPISNVGALKGRGGEGEGKIR